MKSICKIFIGMALISCIGAMAQSTSEQVILESKNVHIPAGYDYNDIDITVFASGELPDTCYRRPEGIVSMDDEGRIRLEITATRISDPKLECLMAKVPFMVEISLGQLGLGNHTIVINAEKQNEKEQEIFVDRPSSASVDNYSYANVTKVERIANSKKILIKGYHPTSCMALRDVKIVANNNRDTFSIQPIIEKSGEVCMPLIEPFSFEVPIEELSEKDILIHVRKIDGRALNTYFPQNQAAEFKAN